MVDGRVAWLAAQKVVLRDEKMAERLAGQKAVSKAVLKVALKAEKKDECLVAY